MSDKFTGDTDMIIRYVMEEKLKNPEVVWDIEKHKEKRSLSQNSYYWMLCGKVAKKQKRSAAYIHNTQLRAVRYLEYINDKPVFLVLPDTDETEKQTMEAMTYHVAPTREVREGKDGINYRTYVMIRGSSDFTVAEMSHLLDLLIQDAEALGIPTITPDELARIRQYEFENEARQNKSNGEKNK